MKNTAEALLKAVKNRQVNIAGFVFPAFGKKAWINIRRLSICLLLLWMVPAGHALAQSATITVNCNDNKGELFRYEAYNNLSGVNTGASTRAVDFAYLNSVGLRSKILRVWISESIYNRTTNTYNYSNYDTYASHASTLADELLIVIPGNTMVDGWNYTPDQCKPILKNIIRHFKQNFPKVKYVEALNEPDLYNSGSIMTSDVVYAYYKPFYQAVNELNAELNLSADPLLVGGPTITSFKYAGDEWLRKFLDGYKNDTDQSKKLDFITFHTYSYKKYPREIETIRPKLEQWLSYRGLPTSIPSFITEVGLFPGADVSGTEEDDALRQAAGMAAYAYWMSTSNKNIPFNWVVRHAAEVRKDQMVTRPRPYSDRLTPYGNMMRMMSMMKITRVGATTNVMDANGMGVYGMAAYDATGLSVMAWNYQHTGIRDYNTTVKINALPAVFNGKAIRKKVYRIDHTTSNNYYDVNNCNLQVVADTTIANPGSSLDLNLGILDENTIQLIVLEPVATALPNTFNLHVTRQANSALLNWITSTETNTTSFDVLHATDGVNFTTLQTLPSAGNSSSPAAYTYVHQNPTPGINYYQVKLFHQNGSTITSGIVSLFMNLVETTTHIYYDFGTTGGEHGNAVSGVPAGWLASTVTVGNATSPTSFYTSTSPSNTYQGNSGQGNITMSARQASLNGKTVTYSGNTTTIAPTSLAALSYFEVTLTPNTNEAVKLEQVRFGSRSIGSAGGPANIIIRTSLDNFATNVFAKDVSANSSWTLVSAVFDQLLTGAAGQPVTLRIYGNDAVGGTGNNWRIDDLDITAIMGLQLPQVHTFTLQEAPANQVLLQWQTSAEDNVSHFEILRSGDGVSFTSIGNVTAVGNSSVTSYYHFTDQSPLPGINHYQVKLVKTNNLEANTEVRNIYIAAWVNTNIYYNFGVTGNEHGNPTSGVPDGWVVSDVTAGNTTRTSDFFSSTSATGSYTGASQHGNITTIAKAGSLGGRTVTYSGVTTTIPQGNINSLSYFQVVLEPSADQIVNINRISFGSRSIGMYGGPANVVIRTSLDNYSSNLFSQDINAESVWQLVTVILGTPIKGSGGQPVTLRIYANDAVGGTNNNWRIDDLDISVTYTPAQGLPVSLHHFTASSQQDGVAIKWRTTSEVNNRSFIVERSPDGKEFVALATVAGKGTNHLVNNYYYLDADALPNTSYYRLKQIDNDGNSNYYGPVVVKRAFNAGLKVYTTSNGVHAVWSSPFATKAAVRVLDMHGRQLAQQAITLQKGINYINLPLSLTNGVYMLELKGEGVSTLKKFLK